MNFLQTIFPFLSYARFRFKLRIETHTVLPPYKGAVFRGAFGNNLRHVVCPKPKWDCVKCLQRAECRYIALFEPPPPSDYFDARKFRQAPRPYVLNPPLTSRQSFHPGDSLEFELVLLGPAIEALPYCIYAFEFMGRRGLGAERGKFRLDRVEQLRGGEGSLTFDPGSRCLTLPAKEKGPRSHAQDQYMTQISLTLLTPLRLKEKGRLATGLSSGLFFASLAQRLSLLKDFYGSGVIMPEWPAGRGAGAGSLKEYLVDNGKDVSITDSNLYWYDWQRHSQRQGHSMNLGGLKGSFSLAGKLGLLLPYLRLGEVVNVGQETSFGLGRYEIETR